MTSAGQQAVRASRQCGPAGSAGQQAVDPAGSGARGFYSQQLRDTTV